MKIKWIFTINDFKLTEQNQRPQINVGNSFVFPFFYVVHFGNDIIETIEFSGMCWLVVNSFLFVCFVFRWHYVSQWCVDKMWKLCFDSNHLGQHFGSTKMVQCVAPDKQVKKESVKHRWKVQIRNRIEDLRW